MAIVASADIVTLAEVRAHLRYPATDTSDDLALQGFIYAADDVIVSECGEVVPKTYDELYDGGKYYIFLRHRPVLEVVNVEEGWGWYNWELDYQQVNTIPAGAMFAYSLDSLISGAVSRRSAGNVMIPFIPGSKNIRVTYRSGLQQIPGSIRLAALELVAHWWQNSQMRSQMANAMASAYDAENADFTRATGFSSINLGVPDRILELLKAKRHMPYFA